MESLFIRPSSLPGGNQWAKACAAISTNVIPKDASPAVVENVELLRESLACDVSTVGGSCQVLALFMGYACVLLYASKMVAKGSELLLFIKSMRNVVNSVVIPILGSVPDGAIVLFSGMGPNAQEKIAIGIGALAGSTIMLLTVPWFIVVFFGRVNIGSDGKAMYDHRPPLWPAHNFSLSRTGVEPKGMVRTAGHYMMLTSLSFVMMQVLALGAGTSFAALHTKTSTAAAASTERIAAGFVLFVCLFFFAYYLYSQFHVTPEKADNREAVLEEVTKNALQDKAISLTAAFDDLWLLSVASLNESTGPVDSNSTRLTNVLTFFFNEFDVDKNGLIDETELGQLMADLGERLDEAELAELHREIGIDQSGMISLEEFLHAIPKFIRSRAARDTPEFNNALAAAEDGGMERLSVEVEDSIEKVSEDLKHAGPRAQGQSVLWRALRKMLLGTILVLLFSDPMVAVLNEIGKRMGIPPFYISFTLAPLASNASEVLVAHSYAVKKTRRATTMGLSMLLGGAILSNTFVLAIFMILIVVQGLAWQFTAETISILFVELAIGWMSQKKVQTLRDGFIVLSLYPASIALVAFLENVIGLD